MLRLIENAADSNAISQKTNTTFQFWSINMIREIKKKEELEQVSGGMVNVASIFASLSNRSGATNSNVSSDTSGSGSTSARFSSFTSRFGASRPSSSVNSSSFTRTSSSSTVSSARVSSSSNGPISVSLFGNATGAASN